MTTAYLNEPLGGALTTTDATPTDVGGLTLAVADKTITVFELEAFAVRQNTSNPLAYYTRRIYTFNRSAGNSNLVASTTLVEHGDASMEAAMSAVGGSSNAKVTVTGLAATTFDWRIVLTRKTYAST